MLINDLKVTINREEVFRQIDCHETSDLYEEILEEYEEIEDKMYELCKPVCLFETGDLESVELPNNQGVFMVLYSIGKEISEYSTKCFHEGDYLKGMLADAMADSALFSLEKEIEPFLKAACLVSKKGISRRMEAPHDVPMEIQKVVFEKVEAAKQCGMGISSGYMIDPVKSNVVLYLLSDDTDEFMVGHNCRKCKNYTCKNRQVPDLDIQVIDGEETYLVPVKDCHNILEALIAKEKSFGAVCGGIGKCGKCKIRVIAGDLPITDADRELFSEEELMEGMRLACKAYPMEPVTIELLMKKEDAFQVVTEHTLEEEREELNIFEYYGIAVDIGTTTIALQLIGLESQRVIKTYTTINHQRQLGADVISRIKASTEGKKEELQQLIRKDLLEGIEKLIAVEGILKEKIEKIVISGNTTMIHLLMGYDCSGLGVFPFTPVNTELIVRNFYEIFDSNLLKSKVVILPAISAFVGGDIVSGLYACDVDMNEEYSLLLDLGTNGEIALGNSKKLMVTSTAAGPAFEGGNITYGVGSIQGAISNVSIRNGEVSLVTIGNKPPTGICGTGVIETVSELVREELVDETGCLDDEYFDDGFPVAKMPEGEEIVFTQQDVREIQLAKAAVRAGIETLFLRYGISKTKVSNVYIAGGFGYKLDCEKAIQIGMIPEEFRTKIKAIGNSSLSGAVKYLLSGDDCDRVRRIGHRGKEINLSADKAFNQLYMEYMYFE